MNLEEVEEEKNFGEDEETDRLTVLLNLMLDRRRFEVDGLPRIKLEMGLLSIFTDRGE